MSLVIVFGAAGRVGRRLLPLLPSQSTTVLGVIRQDMPPDWPADVRPVRLDVADPGDWPCGLNELAGSAAGHRHVVLVDMVLQRTTVSAVRGSIASTSGYLLRLRDRLAAEGRSCALVTASTTAVLAPRLFQTPYGLAKREQLKRYSAAEIAGEALLLPSLRETEAEAIACFGLAWTYREAAWCLADAVARHSMAAPGDSFRVAVPEPQTRYTDAERHQPPDFVRAAIGLVPVHRSLIFGRCESPDVYRDASHYRLALTGGLRRRLDHHFAPAALAHRLSRSLHVPLRILARP